jgi:hypothetical protein
MIRFCPKCGEIPVKCVMCTRAGAFKANGSDVAVHKGRCLYEPCPLCEKESYLEFKKYHEKPKKQLKKLKKLRKRK